MAEAKQVPWEGPLKASLALWDLGEGQRGKQRWTLQALVEDDFEGQRTGKSILQIASKLSSGHITPLFTDVQGQIPHPII